MEEDERLADVVWKLIEKHEQKYPEECTQVIMNWIESVNHIVWTWPEKNLQVVFFETGKATAYAMCANGIPNETISSVLARVFDPTRFYDIFVEGR